MATKKFVYGTDESEVLQGRYPESYSDVIFGYGGDDTIFGGGYDDFLFGGDGNDWLHGGHGADLLHGGAGSDTASYIIPGYGAQSGVTVNLKTGAAFGGDAAGDILISIENVEGSPWDDTLIGDDGDNSLSGGVGHDVLVGGDGKDGSSAGWMTTGSRAAEAPTISPATMASTWRITAIPAKGFGSSWRRERGGEKGTAAARRATNS